MGEIIFISPISLIYLSCHPHVIGNIVKTTSMADVRDDGSDMGEMTGEMAGEMRRARILYLKGLAPSDGRDGALFVNNTSLSVNKASLI